MNIIVKILAALGIIIAIPLILAIFIQKEYHVEREIIINRPKKLVFDYIKYLKNQDNYSVWVRMDPNMKKTFSGTDGTVGFTYAWDGNNKAGKGSQQITQIKDGEKVDIEITFIKPFAGIGYTPITTTAITNDQTKVKWEAKGKSNYPMNFTNLFIDKMLGTDLYKSLEMLKGILEKQ